MESHYGTDHSSRDVPEEYLMTLKGMQYLSSNADMFVPEHLQQSSVTFFYNILYVSSFCFGLL